MNSHTLIYTKDHKWQIPWLKTSNIRWPVKSHQPHTQKLSVRLLTLLRHYQSQDSKDNESLHLYVQHICKAVVIATKFPTWSSNWTPSPENSFALCIRYHIKIWFKRGRGDLQNAKNHVRFPGWRGFILKQKYNQSPRGNVVVHAIVSFTYFTLLL